MTARHCSLLHFASGMAQFYGMVFAFSGGIFLTMWSVNNGMVAFLFTNSVLFGIGIGLSFTVTLNCTVAV